MHRGRSGKSRQGSIDAFVAGGGASQASLAKTNLLLMSEVKKKQTKRSRQDWRTRTGPVADGQNVDNQRRKKMQMFFWEMGNRFDVTCLTESAFIGWQLSSLELSGRGSQAVRRHNAMQISLPAP